MIMPAIQYRQGDILFVKMDETISGDKIARDTQNRLVVAEGEATGHAHAIHDDKVTMYRNDVLNRAWVVVEEQANVVHEEHDTITLESGTWRVIYQRQYVRGETRRVLD